MKKYLITGLLIWIPLVITLWVLNLIVSTMDQSLQLLPAELQPEAVFGRRIPGLGVLLTLLVPMSRVRPMLVAALVGGGAATLLRDMPLRLGTVVAIVACIAAGFLAENLEHRSQRR